MKSQEQRIKDAAKELRRMFPSVGLGGGLGPAQKILEAADRESPKWPTDESVRDFEAAMDPAYTHEDIRTALRAALLADPIIKAAVALRDAYRLPECLDPQVGDLVDAVNEAGL